MKRKIERHRDDDPAARPQDPVHLGDCTIGIWYMLEHLMRHDHIHRLVPEGKVLCIGDD